jgi:anti-anti-sigma regulatory factor
VSDEVFRLSSSREHGMAVLSVVSNSLDLDRRAEFIGACSRLLESGMKRVVIDMRGLRRIYSIFVGTVMDVNARARAEGIDLTVIAGEDVTRLFRSLVGEDVLSICQPDQPHSGKSRRPSSRRFTRRD